MADSNSQSAPEVALTIAGSDSGGGAGMQADLKTFSALGVYGTSAVTLITAQNTQGVKAAQSTSPEVIETQIDAVLDDFEVQTVKTGAFGNSNSIECVAEYFQSHSSPSLVVDPVMVSKHGDPLLPEEAQRAMKEKLVPEGLVITPNKYEAEILSGDEITDLDSMKKAAEKIEAEGAQSVLIKGSHLEPEVVDLYFDGDEFQQFRAARIDTDRTHGSGCTFSAAIAAYLARGFDITSAIRQARSFITKSISGAQNLGRGISPVNPMHEIWS